MQFSVVAMIAAAGVVAAKSNVTVTTMVVDQYVTYCPGPTQITHGTKTWTVTAPTTLTITDCPCTVTKPIITTSTVICNNCPGKNGTVVPPTKTVPPTVPTAGAGKAAALSGAGLAGFVGLAALVL